jgi:hypothetical protein
MHNELLHVHRNNFLNRFYGAHSVMVQKVTNISVTSGGGGVGGGKMAPKFFPPNNIYFLATELKKWKKKWDKSEGAGRGVCVY